MAPLLVAFLGGNTGRWRVRRMDPVTGQGLDAVAFVEIAEGPDAASPANGSAPWTTESTWVLRGTTSNERYVTRAEHDTLVARQEPLGRAASTRAALIPIRKSERWWELSQDERRRIFEERSRHVAQGVGYLPAIARRLHHSRDLGEPFDFLTWFEFAPMDEQGFDELLARLRSTEEWLYVEREIDLRLELAADGVAMAPPAPSWRLTAG